MVYSSGRCYQLNTQGPCKIGEWLDLAEGHPACHPVPADCPIDGKHVFVHTTASARTDRITNTATHHDTNNGQCWELFTRGPCRQGLVVRRVEPDLIVRCATAASSTVEETRINNLPALLRPALPCHRGSRRSQNNQCSI
jgi:hypothetical protein